MIPQQLIISFYQKEADSLLLTLTELCAQARCVVLQTRYARLGEATLGFMYLQGNWPEIVRLEKLLERLNTALEESVFYTRATVQTHQTPMVSYFVQIVGTNRPEILQSLVDFFRLEALQLVDLSSHQYHTAHTHTAMLSIQGTVLIPADDHLAQVRDAFLCFCEAHNLDAVFEPERG